MQPLIGYCRHDRSPCPHRSRRLASALGPPSGIAPWTQCPSVLYAPPPQQSPRRSQYRLHRDMSVGLFAIGPRRMWMDMAWAGCVASVSLSLALRGIASTYNRSIKPSFQPNVTWTWFLLFLILKSSSSCSLASVIFLYSNAYLSYHALIAASLLETPHHPLAFPWATSPIFQPTCSQPDCHRLLTPDTNLDLHLLSD